MSQGAITGRLFAAWAIVSILWTTLYVAVFALAGGNLSFEKIWSDILTPPAMLLIAGSIVIRIVRSLRRAVASHDEQ